MSPSRHRHACILALQKAAALIVVGLIACAVTPTLFSEAAYADATQTRPLLVIVAGLDGDGGEAAVPYSESYDWGQTIFGSGDTLAGYYLDMSLGAFTFAPAYETCAYGAVDDRGYANANAYDQEGDGVVHVTIGHAYNGWGLVNEDDAVADDFAEVVLEAFDASARYVDYETYDANGDGRLTTDELTVTLLIPGYDASTLVQPDRTDLPVMWPHSGTISKHGSIPEDYDGIVLDSYVALTENLWIENGDTVEVQQEPMGVLYHELGHSLGLPDLYPLDRGQGPWSGYEVESLSLMASGAWTYVADYGSGAYRYSPIALDGWSRYMLGWAMPRVVTSSGDYEVCSDVSPSGYSSLLVPTKDPDQYFLIENRQIESHDSALGSAYPYSASAGGLVIWHIDKGVYRAYCDDNGINDTVHRPAVMPVFFETLADASAYSTSWQETVPDRGNPFFSGASVQALLGDVGQIELPLYDPSVEEDVPAARVPSGISISCADGPAQVMTVHVEMPGYIAGESFATYELAQSAKSSDEGQEDATLGETPLEHIACAALLADIGADVSLVATTDIKTGISAGLVSYDDIYAALPSDTTVRLYDITGSQLAAFVEAVARSTRTARQDISIGGLGFIADYRSSAQKTVSSLQVGASPLRNKKIYRVAATESVAEAYGLDDVWHRDSLELCGSPADALRSFIQRDKWGQIAEDLVGTRSYLRYPRFEPEPEPEPIPASDEAASGSDTAWVFAIASITVAIIVFLRIGFSELAKRRRRNVRRSMRGR